MKENILKCPCTLSGRTAIGLNQFVNALHCLVWIEKVSVGRRVNCSSLIGVLSLGIVEGDEIKITIDNGDEGKNFDKIVAFLNGEST